VPAEGSSENEREDGNHDNTTNSDPSQTVNQQPTVCCGTEETSTSRSLPKNLDLGNTVDKSLDDAVKALKINHKHIIQMNLLLLATPLECSYKNCNSKLIFSLSL
jgi:hypothetical protein